MGEGSACSTHPPRTFTGTREIGRTGTQTSRGTQDDVRRRRRCMDVADASGARRRMPTMSRSVPPARAGRSARLVGVADVPQAGEKLAVGGESLLSLDPDAG